MTRREEIDAARRRFEEAQLKAERLEVEFDARVAAVSAAQREGSMRDELIAREEETAIALVTARGQRVARRQELWELLAQGRASLPPFPFFVVSRPATSFRS